MSVMLRRGLLIMTMAVTVFGASLNAAGADPFARLFPTPAQRSQEQNLPKPWLPQLGFDARAVPARPQVKCIRTVHVDPAFDAAMKQQAPRDPKPAMRVIPAPACQP